MLEIKTQLAILVGLSVGRIGKEPDAEQRTALCKEIKGYLLDQQVWPSSAIMQQVNRLIDEAVAHLERKQVRR